MPNAIADKTLVVSNIPTHVLAASPDVPIGNVCFLHGWLDSSERFRPFVERAVDEGYRAVAVDLPGFGRTPRPSDAWGTDEYSRFVEWFCEKQFPKGEKIAFVAHSMGARFAARLAARRPDLVSALVFTGAAGVPPARSGFRAFATRIGRAVFSLPGLRGWHSRLRRRFSSRDAGLSERFGLSDIFRAVIAGDNRPDYPDIAAPVLLLWGRDDDQTPLADLRVMRSLLPDSRERVFDGGHEFFSDVPDEFWSVASEFLRSSR